MDKKICVKFTGGREVTGTLKGYDALMNLVLDDVDEVVRGLSPTLTARVKGESKRREWSRGKSGKSLNSLDSD
jgi:small nuclear ribonucleoprotein (snRNP)-like protein